MVIISGAIYYHRYAFGALFLIITALSICEFHTFTRRRELRTVSAILGIALFLLTFFYASGEGWVGLWTFLPYIILLLSALFVIGLLLKSDERFKPWMMVLFAQIYCAGSLSLLNFIAFDPQTHAYSPWFVLLVFVFVWLNDTCAYLIGTAFGRHKMAPCISPLKSWEGFFGGLVVVMAAAVAFARYFTELMSAWQWIAFAAIVVVFATLGDLVESLMKRSFGVKDSGTLLPGHGGLLDRLDSVILAIPAVYLFITFFIRN